MSLLDFMWHRYCCASIEQHFDDFVVVLMRGQNKRSYVWREISCVPVDFFPALLKFNTLH